MSSITYYAGGNTSQVLKEHSLFDSQVGETVRRLGIPVCEVDSDGSLDAFLRKLSLRINLFANSDAREIVRNYLIDRDALVAVYNAGSGNAWHRRMNWMSTYIPLSDWSGVTMRKDMLLVYKNSSRSVFIGRVIGLDLSHNNMYTQKDKDNGKIAAQIGRLSELRSLNLSYNFLTGPIPNEICNLTKLEELYLHFNQLSGGISSNVGRLTHLRKLQVDHNKLTGPIPSALGDLKELEILCVHENNLDSGTMTVIRRVLRNPNGVIKGDARQMARLRRAVQRIEIEVPIPTVIANLPKLYKFYAYGNQLSGKLSAAIVERMQKNAEWQLVLQQDKVTLS